MQSGTTGINSIRIYDPTKRGWITIRRARSYGVGCPSWKAYPMLRSINRGFLATRSSEVAPSMFHPS